MDNKALITMTADHIRIIAGALLPEVQDDNGFRSDVSHSFPDERTLQIVLRAEDLSALRASLNMWLRLIQVADEMYDITARTAR